MKYCCQICEYVGDPGLLPCDCEPRPCPEGAPRPGCAGPTVGCPVCLDGSVDPWALIREIRTLIGSLGESVPQGAEPLTPTPTERADSAGTAPPIPSDSADPFASEWDLLRVSIASIWSDLSADDLASVQADRVRFEGLLRRRYGYGTALAHQLTTGLLDVHDRFKGRWEVVAECVPRFWPNISATEVRLMNGTIPELAGLIERRYLLARGEGRQQVAEFLDEIDYPTLVRLYRGASKPAMHEFDLNHSAEAGLQRDTTG